MKVFSGSPAANLRGTTSLLRFASLAALIQMASADPSISYNTGSLGIAGDGANSTGVILDQPGAVVTAVDYSSSYAAGERTNIPLRSELNPPAASPFTIEFWARPTAADGDDAVVANRFATGDRSGWVFFQRDAATGWNFRMYNGTGGNVGWDLTGGTATLNAWSHVVAVWSGSGAALYVNGAPTGAPNTGLGGYNVNVTQNFYLGAQFDGGSPITGSVDEVAFYPTALTADQILAHYKTATGASSGSYSSLVLADGAVEYLQQNPPEAKVSIVAANPTVTFTGILAQSPDLVNWTDVVTTSPYTVPSPQPAMLFFRGHR